MGCQDLDLDFSLKAEAVRVSASSFIKQNDDTIDISVAMLIYMIITPKINCFYDMFHLSF